MRTIESPGVEINEIDVTSNTELPYGTTSLVVGYANQGPTDELLNVRSPEELEQVYGLPENAAERYMYHTARQVLNANGNLLITRLPYGSGDGSGYSTKYSALVYPYIPITTNTCGTYPVSSTSVDDKIIYTFTAAETGLQVTTTNDFAILSSINGFTPDQIGISSFSQFTFEGAISGVASSLTFDITGSTVAGTGGLAGINFYGELKAVEKYDDSVYGPTYYALLSSSSSLATFGAGVLSSSFVACGLSATVTSATPTSATHFYLGQPIHIALDDDTYFNWLQGGINWKSTVDNGVSGLMSDNISTILSNVGYGALVVVNEAKTTITEQFEGYYIAIADNSKMDKGSNFDSIMNIKSFNQYSEENDWVTLNPNSLAFSLTGSYFEHSGSISEIVESVPDFDFANSGAGGFGDSIVLTLFKVRPSIYNQDTRVLDKVLYETHIGSLDSTRMIQNQNGGSALNFFIEDIVNTKSNNLKVFVNPYISKFSGNWFNSQTQEPIKYVRVVCGERNVLGSDSTDIIGASPAEPHGTAELIFDSINSANGLFCATADSLYGMGESTPCQPDKEKFIGNLPRKIEKALRLAENNELLRIDLVPEGGLGTIWTGMNLDINNWPAGTTTRSGVTRIKELFDENVYVNGILNSHTFDKDSDGLLSQNNGSASEASDLYESVASLFVQFCQYTRKDCLSILDPLRYIFVQGNGDVKVMDNKKLNFSQHIFWPLKNLFNGINSSYACTYANWFKVNDTISDRFVWVPSSGYAANLMIKTDTNFFPWYTPAGMTRGILTGLLDIGINPSQKQRDLLYKNGINPTVYWPGDGYVVWGQKTLQRKPSAFDRINVRRLFLWCEKAVMALAKYYVFEQNTVFTRNRLKLAIDPVLSFAKSNEGIYEYMIVCDDRNNTTDVIDRNELIVDVYIKPVRVAEYILINFIATRTGQRFDELV
ncbi:MAG: phage tail sheath subtilisin-like domain-containing protein [Clostridia bacterium]|nr:phage tail sheath subtilisin-like domain-containing protein [Clostridia bacterium]